MLGLSLSCILGLLVGGALGAYGFILLSQIRSGRINVPDYLPLGPVKIDLRGLKPLPADPDMETAEPEPFDPSEVRPVVEVGGSVTGSCLSIVAALLVLVGFVLPWFSCNIASFISGSFSGLTVLVQLIVASLGALAGLILGRQSDTTLFSGGLFVIIIGAVIFVALIPYSGYRIGKAGFELLQVLRVSSTWQRAVSKTVIRAAIIGLVPIICYLSSASASIDFPALGPLDVPVEVASADIGLWITLGGFVVAVVAGMVLSTAAALADQLVKSNSRRH